MINDIKLGKEILMPSSLPNIKVVKNNDKFILFDGHHSILAYLFCVRNKLSEVPHLIVSNVSNEDFKVFFSKHSSKIDNWRNYVINWQNPPEKQLCKRIQNNIGNIFDLIKIYKT